MSYTGLHNWIVSQYGKAYRCESQSCRGVSKQFDWCLKKGAEYSRERTVWIQLCRSCHIKYDMTEERKSKIIKNLIPGDWKGRISP